jgi:protein-disulfide isomerase
MAATADDLLPTGDPGGEVQVAVDDDPGLGDPNAPLTMVEFSDYECPFCKSFFEETLPKIKEQYIDTGKLRFVYRDLPLSFHEPAASKEALAANCARDQKGDEGYFLYHDEIFARTTSNGEGMKSADYAAAATKIGLDVSAFNSCLSTEKFKDEVAADLAAVEKLTQDYSAVFQQGIGTPTFIVGKTDSSGTFTGQVVSGAQPFESFQQIIDELLK